ncbi:glutamine synthetase family protein [bacterium]|nr:glutamine synthetase family protein [bacterium]MBU1983204.1 glutamine synthetase family protein [bacterium]
MKTTRTNRSAARTKSKDAGQLSGKLAGLLRKSNSAWTIDDLVAVVRDQNIRVVSLMHVGGDGWLKTLDFVPQSAQHLRDILSAGERGDGSSIFAGLGISAGASDIILHARPQTAFLDPFAAEPTLAVLCGHLGRDGKPLPVSPDTVLNLAYERLKHETGVDLHGLGEVEYFVGRLTGDGDTHGTYDRGYHATAPFVFGEKLRRQALSTLADMGVPIKYGHSEVGYIPPDGGDHWIWEQHEVEMQLQPLPRAAESVVLTHWVLRNLAVQHGMRCSFDPIVKPGHAGNGMHFHLALQTGGKYQSVHDSKGQLRAVSKWLIGGLVQYGGVLMAFGNRSRESFVRLMQGKEAPNTVTWGRYNRKALVRLPIVPRDAKGRPVCAETIEYRLPDGSAHPYLLLAGIAQAMIAGKNMVDLDERVAHTAIDATPDVHDDATRVPRTFGEVVEALETHRQVFEAGGVFPTQQIDSVIENLRDTLREVPRSS